MAAASAPHMPAGAAESFHRCFDTSWTSFRRSRMRRGTQRPMRYSTLACRWLYPVRRVRHPRVCLPVSTRDAACYLVEFPAHRPLIFRYPSVQCLAHGRMSRRQNRIVRKHRVYQFDLCCCVMLADLYCVLRTAYKCTDLSRLTKQATEHHLSVGAQHLSIIGQVS